MYSEVKPRKSFEIVKVSRPDIWCDGGRLGHPRVYLQINPDLGKIACPYCTREFVLTTATSQGGH